MGRKKEEEEEEEEEESMLHESESKVEVGARFAS